MKLQQLWQYADPVGISFAIVYNQLQSYAVIALP